MSNPHSEEAFQARLDVLQNKIKEQITIILDNDDGGDPPMKSFLDICKTFSSANDSLKKAQTLLAGLEKDKSKDDTAIQKAQDLVNSCQETLTDLWVCVIDCGTNAIQNLNLDEKMKTKDDKGTLEATVLECTVLVQATPKGLAEFCSVDEATHGPLVDAFLSNSDWMKLMIQFGGPSNGNYGQAILLHTTLLKEIIKSDNHDGSDDDDQDKSMTARTTETAKRIRRNLALAVALEMASPIAIFHNPKEFIDPIERFWQYVNAYENNELDGAFETFTVWELRHVIDSDAPSDQLEWGRSYLKAYRPDQIWSDSDRWKYVWSVRTDINYRHPEHDFSTYQDLLSAGGECGARAWFGRFIAKAFGMPTWGVRQ